MLCPLAKSNAGAIWYTQTLHDSDSDREKEEKLFQCDGRRCGWWDGVADQCSMITIAMELRQSRREGR